MQKLVWPCAPSRHHAWAFATAAGDGAWSAGVFEAGDVKMQRSGVIFHDVKVAYEVHGTMNADKSNVILVIRYSTMCV